MLTIGSWKTKNGGQLKASAPPSYPSTAVEVCSRRAANGQCEVVSYAREKLQSSVRPKCGLTLRSRRGPTA